MKYKINAYLATLIVTIVGAGAALFIIRVAYANTFTVVLVHGETGYVQYFK